MKAIKIILRVILCLVISILIYVICVMSFAFSPPRPCPGDYPNSKWIYDGEYTEIELNVNEDNFSNGRIITQNGEKEVVFGYHTQNRHIMIYTTTEETVDGATQYIYEEVFGGSYSCNEKRMIVTGDYYGPEWHMENSEIRIDSLDFAPVVREVKPYIKLEFVRVE